MTGWRFSRLVTCLVGQGLRKLDFQKADFCYFNKTGSFIWDSTGVDNNSYFQFHFEKSHLGVSEKVSETQNAHSGNKKILGKPTFSRTPEKA